MSRGGRGVEGRCVLRECGRVEWCRVDLDLRYKKAFRFRNTHLAETLEKDHRVFVGILRFKAGSTYKTLCRSVLAAIILT